MYRIVKLDTDGIVRGFDPRSFATRAFAENVRKVLNAHKLQGETYKVLHVSIANNLRVASV